MNSQELMNRLAPLFYVAYNKGLSYEFDAIVAVPSETDKNLPVYRITDREVSAFSVTLSQCYAYCPDFGYPGNFVEIVSFLETLIKWIATETLVDYTPRIFAKFIVNSEDAGAVKVVLRYK